MASETFEVAIFIVTAVVAAAILVSAVFPIVNEATGTFTQTAADADSKERTKLTIVNTYLSGSDLKVWLKNTGTGRISVADLNKANFFGGSETVYTIYSRVNSAPSDNQWSYSILSGDSAYLNTGDTLEITANGVFPTASSGDYAYMSFVLPNGVRVSGTFAPNV